MLYTALSKTFIDRSHMNKFSFRHKLYSAGQFKLLQRNSPCFFRAYKLKYSGAKYHLVEQFSCCL